MKGPLLCWATGWKALAHLTPYTPTLVYPTLLHRLPLPFLQLCTLLAILYYLVESGLGLGKKSSAGRKKLGRPAFLPSNSTGRPCHQGPPLFVYFSIIIYGCSKCGEYLHPASPKTVHRQVAQTQFELGRLTICNPVVKPTM